MITQTRSCQPPVAIIGMGAMFANSKNLKSYWRILRNGIDCITDPPESHCQLKDIHDADPTKKDTLAQSLLVELKKGHWRAWSRRPQLEWGSVTCRAVDLSPEFSEPKAMSKRVADELLSTQDKGPIEIGLFPIIALP